MTSTTSDPNGSTDQTGGSDRTRGTGEVEARPTDMVDDILAEARQELARRRERGELPPLPDGELDRQFDAVIEAVDAGLVEDPPVSLADLHRTAALETWQPDGGGLRSRAAHLHSRLVGAVVRRQATPFTHTTIHVVNQLLDRQARTNRFLTRAHLDRLRTLESRVAELEREVDRLRDQGTPGAHDPSATNGNGS